MPNILLENQTLSQGMHHEPLDLGKAIYNDRIPINEIVVIYFYVDTECEVEP
jgi:hypothetical protein